MTILPRCFWVPVSFAIWNKNKFVVAIATSVWVTNVAFLIRGRALLILVEAIVHLTYI
jgi:hypothetical protein